MERPRERMFQYGGERISTEELLTLLIGSGTRGASAASIAARLIKESGGLEALARSRPAELCTVDGIGWARAARISAAFHLGRRALEASAEHDYVGSPAAAFARLRPRLTGLRQEVFVVLALNTRNAVIDEIEIARGGLAGVEVHPREVFRPLIRLAAAATVVAHNHPSGDPHPSEQDLALTHRLVAAGELVGVPVLDHIVVGNTGYVSIMERLGVVR